MGVTKCSLALPPGVLPVSQGWKFEKEHLFHSIKKKEKEIMKYYKMPDQYFSYCQSYQKQECLFENLS